MLLQAVDEHLYGNLIDSRNPAVSLLSADIHFSRRKNDAEVYYSSRRSSGGRNTSAVPALSLARCVFPIQNPPRLTPSVKTSSADRKSYKGYGHPISASTKHDLTVVTVVTIIPGSPQLTRVGARIVATGTVAVNAVRAPASRLRLFPLLAWGWPAIALKTTTYLGRHIVRYVLTIHSTTK